MKFTISRLLVGVGCFLLVANPALAHHGGSIFFDMSKTTTLEATVTEYRFMNPHVQIFFDARDEDGKVKHWTAEASGPNALRRRQWTADLLKPGDHVTIVGNRAQNGVTSLHLRKLILANGHALDAAGDPPS